MFAIAEKRDPILTIWLNHGPNVSSFLVTSLRKCFIGVGVVTDFWQKGQLLAGALDKQLYIHLKQWDVSNHALASTVA